MRKLPLPVDLAPDVYELCVSRVRNLQLRGRLRRVAPRIEAAAIEFSDAGAARAFYQIAPAAKVGRSVTSAEMVAVYDLRMARKRASGRPVYDRLMAATPNMQCPLCGQRVVSTLDHYLPKARFPALSVVPLNLIPACIDCNKLKLERIANTAEEQTLHTYFDDLNNDCWLSARVEELSPATVEFFVALPNTWDAIVTSRVCNHFEVFGLAKLYRSHAAVELTNIQFGLSRLHAQAGSASVRLHLTSTAESRGKAHINSWQTAMYWALATNDWYCDGGFNA